MRCPWEGAPTCKGFPGSRCSSVPHSRTSGWCEPMSRYVVGRILQAFPTLLLTSVGIFVLLRLVPGDPALALAGPDATPETIRAIRLDLGLDQVLPFQYAAW